MRFGIFLFLWLLVILKNFMLLIIIVMFKNKDIKIFNIGNIYIFYILLKEGFWFMKFFLDVLSIFSSIDFFG